MQKISFCERYMLTTAVLDGTKTMTRRVEKGLQRGIAEYEKMYHETFNFNSEYQSWGSTINKLVVGAPHATIYLPTRYKLGEVVAVAQAYKDVFSDNDLAIFDDGLEIKLSKGWNNKLFVKPDLMKHRIQMTGVRIEKLQAISDDDCLKEGVVKFDYGFYVPNLYRIPSRGVLYSYKTPREAFAALIDRPGVGRKGLWESNPFVVVYEFKLIK